MIRREHLGQSAPELASHVWRVDGLRIIRTLFEPGQWVATRVPERCSYADWESVHMQTAGSSHELGGGLPAIGPGWMSRRDDFVMEPGDYKRVFDTDAEYWCCLWSSERSSADVDCVKVAAGQMLELSVGAVLFVTNGAFNAGGVELQAPQVLRIDSAGRQLVAQTDVYAFTWREHVAEAVGPGV